MTNADPVVEQEQQGDWKRSRERGSEMIKEAQGFEAATPYRQPKSCLKQRGSESGDRGRERNRPDRSRGREGAISDGRARVASPLRFSLTETLCLSFVQYVHIMNAYVRRHRMSRTVCGQVPYVTNRMCAGTVCHNRMWAGTVCHKPYVCMSMCLCVSMHTYAYACPCICLGLHTDGR